MQLEQTQVKLKLVDNKFNHFDSENGQTITGKDIRQQLNKNGVWKNDSKGKYIGVQFDGHEFMFRDGEIIVVGATIARALIRSSRIIVGDQLTGAIVPFLEVVETYALGQASPSDRPATACPICGEDQKTFPALARHLGKERKLHPELFKEEKVDWDGDEETKPEEVEA